jgi:hypothetical protein
MTTLRLKLRDDAGEDARGEVVAGVERLGATVEPVFPGATDAELATLFTITITVADDEATRVVSFLARSRAVEFAEQEAGRRLILPEELRRRG